MLTARSRLVLTIHAIVAIVAVGGVAGDRRLSAAGKVPPVSWNACHRDLGLPFECGQVQVPLDHDDPGGAAISIAVVRLPPSDPGRRIGSLSDSINPASHAVWSAAADASEAQFGYFGRIWTWISSPCAVWPGADGDRYLGPFNRSTSNAVLVVGTTFDPATRYEGAVTVSILMPNASLLTVQGWAHTSLLLSQCADQAVAGYLLTTVPPPFGTACAQDFVPFT